MFTSSSRRLGGGGNPNRWLLLAGAGLLALGFVLRLMMDIGRTDATTPEDVAVGTDSASLAATPSAAATAGDPVQVPPDTTAAAIATDTAATPPPRKPDPVTVTPAPRPAPPAAVTGAFIVQLGVFSAEANARRVADRALALGYPAQSAPVGEAGKYRVRVGGFATRADAQAAVDSLDRGLGLKAVVLRR